MILALCVLSIAALAALTAAERRTATPTHRPQEAPRTTTKRTTTTKQAKPQRLYFIKATGGYRRITLTKAGYIEHDSIVQQLPADAILMEP